MRGDNNANGHFTEYANEAFSQNENYHPRGGKKLTAKFDGYSTETSDDEASIDEDENNSAQEFTDDITEAACLIPSDQISSKNGKE